MAVVVPVRNEKLALSIGWSLEGNQQAAPWGCPDTINLSSVAANPEPPSASTYAE